MPDSDRRFQLREFLWPRKRSQFFALLVLVLLIGSSAVFLLPYFLPSYSAVLPRSYGDPWFYIEKSQAAPKEIWKLRVKGQDAMARTLNPRIVFIGDSITEGWAYEGSRIWENYYAPRNAMNLGIGGERTEHLLWRMRKISLEKMDPEAVVILIGVNNLLSGDSPEETARGVLAVARLVRRRMPETQVILLAIFPAGRRNRDSIRRSVVETNREIQRRVAGMDILYLDLGDVFLDENGMLSKTLSTDRIHLNEEGYRRWAEAMEPILEESVGPLENVDS